MNRDPLNILNHARGLMIEQIMALEGRGKPSPRAFRDELEKQSSAQLAHRLELLTDFPVSAEAPQCAEAKPRVPNGDVPETREDHANRSELPTRETLILQSSLP